MKPPKNDTETDPFTLLQSQFDDLRAAYQKLQEENQRIRAEMAALEASTVTTPLFSGDDGVHYAKPIARKDISYRPDQPGGYWKFSLPTDSA